MTHYLHFWRAVTVMSHLTKLGARALVVASSDQFEKVHPGDVVWIVSCFDEVGIALVGRLEVHQRVGRAEAAMLLGSTGFWAGDSIVISARDRALPLRIQPIPGAARTLRFQSKRDRLIIEASGWIDPKQLQRMRRLDESSGNTLEDEWAQGLPNRPASVDLVSRAQ
jgi:hypothetical protein